MNVTERLVLAVDQHAIDLWYCRDDQVIEPSILTWCYAQLSDAEKQQYRRFVFERHRHQYLLSRALVRSILSLYEPRVSPDLWKFTTNAHGKPEVSAPLPAPVRFNLAHTSGLLVLAVTKHSDVGVDVESRTRGSRLVDICEHFFSAAEVNQLRALSDEEQRVRFHELWTLKEAYIKARGLGLALPLDGFSFEFPGPHDVAVRFGPAIRDDAGRWRFWLLKPTADHTVAVAVTADCLDDDLHICARDFVPPAAFTAVEWPCSRSSAGLRQPI